MTYFLVSGDEQATPEKLKTLIRDHVITTPVTARSKIRLESENFVTLNDYEVVIHKRRVTSHGIIVKSTGANGLVSTPFQEPYAMESGRYNVGVHYLDEENQSTGFELAVNGVVQGTPWKSSGEGKGWTVHEIDNVSVNVGDEISVKTSGGEAQLDYVQLNERATEAPDKTDALGPLDDPEALPGQIIVAGMKPGYLKYNGGGPAFLCGPDNPEDFLFRGTLNADGTRSGGGQEEMIEKLAKAGVNAFHCQMFRMKRCNYKDEGNDTHCPFVDHDPAKPLNEKVLDQWDGWLGLFEKHGINVHLEFYNDATDVEMMDWKLDADGNLPKDERRWIAGIVERFKHRKNILWGVEERLNKLSREHTAHFKKIGELIAKTDNHNHPIVQSFVVPNDPEGDFPENGLTPDEYIDDPNTHVVTWLHVVPHRDGHTQ